MLISDTDETAVYYTEPRNNMHADTYVVSSSTYAQPALDVQTT